eukprot:2533572-Alexandrium_andersonii.AAC.1
MPGLSSQSSQPPKKKLRRGKALASLPDAAVAAPEQAGNADDHAIAGNATVAEAEGLPLATPESPAVA